MTWEPELDELRRREELARRMGGEERVERQHASGRLTVRERIERLADPGSFHETGALAGTGTYADDGTLEAFTPANVIVGRARLDGRRAVLQADDFTVRGGAADAAIWEKFVWAERAAHDLRLPLVRLVDGTGGGGSVKSLLDMGFSYVPPLPGFELTVANLARVPVVAAALGPCAGLGAARVVMSHFSVIVRDTAQLFVAGPPLVAAAMGESPDKEQLGGARLQTRAGAVDNEADGEDDAFAQIKRFLSYLPSSVWEAPPVVATTDPADRREEELLSIVPRDERKSYNMRRVLELVLDRGSLFELGRRFGGPTITALARLDGRPVGVIASDPKHYGGGVTADAAEKMARFVDLCDQFRLPVVNFVDVPGFLIGSEAERQATIRRAGRRVPGHRAVVLGAGAQGLRGGGRRPRRRLPAEPALRVAVGRLGLAAAGRRHRGGVQAPPGGRGRPRGGPRRPRARPDAAARPVPHGRALQRRGDHRPARDAADPVRVGRPRARARRDRGARGPQGARAAAVAFLDCRPWPPTSSSSAPTRSAGATTPARSRSSTSASSTSGTPAAWPATSATSRSGS
jgi:acetyl-CoA carboxylase carboxyltransferase component